MPAFSWEVSEDMADIYFAGVFMVDPQNPKGEKVFCIVKPYGEKELPYLTRSPKGLRSTEHHSNLYRLSGDGKTATIADFRCPDADCGMKKVWLTERQQEDIQKAIEANRFYL